MLCGLVALCGTACSPSGRPDLRRADGQHNEADFISLFDGTSTEGWNIYIEPGPKSRMRIDGQERAVEDVTAFPDAFYLEDGAIACKGYGYHWFRYETRPFADFVLRLEFKTARETNSGVCLRTLKEGAPPFTGFEIQISDDTNKDPNRRPGDGLLDPAGTAPNKHSTGAIYDIVTPMYNASRPIGEWNEMEITCDGHLVKVILNGFTVIDTDFSKLTAKHGKFDFPYAQMPRSGYIALQDHWTPIWYRNIRIKTLNE
jgi:hypothetical protein